MHYPMNTLLLLEREPIVYFGCTWSEIKSAFIKGFFQSALITFVLAIIPWPFTRMFIAIPFFLIWWFISTLRMRTLRKLRSGKPLYFERHVGMLKRSNPFINVSIFKQTDRNGNRNA